MEALVCLFAVGNKAGVGQSRGLGCANIVAAPYDIVPSWHVHAHVLEVVISGAVLVHHPSTVSSYHCDWNVWSVRKDELDVFELSPSSPGFCK